MTERAILCLLDSPFFLFEMYCPLWVSVVAKTTSNRGRCRRDRGGVVAGWGPLWVSVVAKTTSNRGRCRRDRGGVVAGWGPLWVSVVARRSSKLASNEIK